MNQKHRRAGLLLALLPMLTAGTAVGEERNAGPAQVMEQPALDLLRGMSSKLAAAKSFTFRTRSSIEAPGGTGQFLSFFADSEAAVMRPDKVSARIRGDSPPFDFYFDGARMTVYEPTAKLYASEDAPKTIDDMLPFAAQKAGILLPFADVLYSDPYAVLTRGITSAFYAGYSTIGGARCAHLALSAPGIDWQIWINTETSLPCLLTGAMRDVQGAPRFAVEFADWKLDAPLAPEGFVLVRPADADRMDFRALTGQ